jgi:hypothetical protein
MTVIMHGGPGGWGFIHFPSLLMEMTVVLNNVRGCPAFGVYQLSYYNAYIYIKPSDTPYCSWAMSKQNPTSVWPR